MAGDANVFKRKGEKAAGVPKWLQHAAKQAATPNRSHDTDDDGDHDADASAARRRPRGVGHKHISVLLDVSGSMYRFNGLDRRLEKLMSTSILLMEAFAHIPSPSNAAASSKSSALTFSMAGHSGDS